MVKDVSKDQKVIDMLVNDTMRAKFRTPALLEGYWHGLAESGDIPFRSQLDPRALEPVLEYAFILERIAPGICRFRLAGRHLNDLMGQEVRGMPITAIFEPEARKEVSLLIEKTCLTGALIDARLVAESGFGRGSLQARMFLAPLRDDSGQVTRILGCLESLGKIGRQPRRFTVAHSEANGAGQFQTPEIAIPAQDQVEFSEPAARFEHKTDPQENAETKKPSSLLRLVVDNS